MNYKTSIHTGVFVHGFNSEQRFHQTYGRIMSEWHVRCSSVQCHMAIKIYLMQISLVKDVLLFQYIIWR